MSSHAARQLKASGNGTLDDAKKEQSCSGAGSAQGSTVSLSPAGQLPLCAVEETLGKCREKLPTELSTKGPLNEDVGRASRGLLM